jgi:acyl-CoA reductase-like NAD-dependent aldehyde dehydrogenase
MKAYDLYSSGKFITTNVGFTVKDKFSGEEFAKVCTADHQLLEQAIVAAVKSENEMEQLSSHRRFEILSFIANELYKNRHEMAEIIAREAGKPLKYALIEAERASQTFLIAAEESKRISSEIYPLDWFGEMRKEAIVKMFPIGTVAGITPFNFPLNLVAHKVAPAIAAGCPIILKPATATPLAALELAKIIDKSNLPKGAFCVIPMSHNVSKPLIVDDRIKKISFTGSQEIGWEMKKQCGKKRITLELGGNAAAIVTDSADLDEAVAKCVTGAFAYSGQVCIHTQRIFVQKSMFSEFLEKFTEKTKSLRYGNPLETNTDISILIDEPNAIRVESWIKEAIAEGAKLISGGKRTGNFVEPTILSKTKPGMKVRKDEVFGPIVCIEEYDSFENAIALTNDSVFGLQAGVFTNRIDEMNRAFREIKVGGVMINESPTFRMDQMPYGGVKESGFGKEGVKYAIHEMSEIKVMVKGF